MDLRSQLVGELQDRTSGRLVDVDPARLAASVTRVLGCAGAGIGVVQPLVLLPVGASGGDARIAEQVQASVGTAPVLDAVACGAPVAADEADLRRSWPLYHQLLTGRTFFRSTASFPLRRGGRVFAALDVYSDEAHWRLEDDLVTVQAQVADLVATMLLGLFLRHDVHEAWPAGEAARGRQQVWVAVGMVREAAHLDDGDALALLRAYAFAEDLLLDEVADRLLTGQLDPATVAGSP